MIVSCMTSWLYFLMYSLACFLMVLHISAYSIRCLLSSFPAISRCFFIRAHVGDAILDFCGFLIALAILDAPCWIVCVMVSPMVSMSSSSCSVSNRCLSIQIGIKSSLVLLVWHLLINVFLSTSTSSLTLLIASLWSLPMMTWLIMVTYMTMSRLLVRMYSISVFVTPFELFMILYFLDVAHSTKVSLLLFLNPSPN